MKINVGSVDRVIRIVLGLVIVCAGFYYKNWWGLVGLLPLLTGIFRFCPGYLPFGINTCNVKTDTTAPRSTPPNPVA